MVDLHCHILPGLDDGPPNLEAALDMARAAQAAGIRTVLATPHIRDDHPFGLELIDERLDALRRAMSDTGVDLEVLRGGEVDLAKSTELDDETLGGLCLGEGRYLLVESPYTQAPSFLETALFDLQIRGFRPVLAHPERSRTFLDDIGRLELLVERGVLCSVTGMSIAGAFGKTVRKFALSLFRAGLAHNVASDAHDAVRRPPDLASALAGLQGEFHCDAKTALWFTRDSPAAILDGSPLAARPPELEGHPSAWARMRRRSRLA